MMKKLEEYVVSIPDFPEPGIIFRDVTSILQDADGLKLAIDGLMESLKAAHSLRDSGLWEDLLSPALSVPHSVYFRSSGGVQST